MNPYHHPSTIIMDRARDYKIAFVTGLASGVLWFFVLKRLALAEDELLATLFALPVLFFLAAVAAHRFFGGHDRKGHIFHKVARFLMVGVLNTGIDFFVFNMFIAASGLAQGLPVVLFKSVSFLCALVNSYELNRRWTFDGDAAETRTAKEFAQFAAVTAIGFLVNVGVTAAIVGLMRPAFGLSQVRWDNVAAVAATALGLAWNFMGYKWLVFPSARRREKENSIIPDVL